MATAALVVASPSPRLFQNNVAPGFTSVELHHFRVSNGTQHAKADGHMLHVQHISRKTFAFSRSLIYCGSSSMGKRLPLKPVNAVGSGLEATLTDPDKNLIRIKNVEIVVESKDDDKMQVRVDLPGKETQIVFEKILRNLARAAPPVPGFRREKGGKTSNVPTEFLLQIIGEDRVTNFTILEIVTTTISDYVKKENLTVKENKIDTIQTSDELKSLFTPGKDFGFNATIELENLTEAELADEEE